MSIFNFKSINSALDDSTSVSSGVDFSGKSLKLDSASDAQPIVDAINACNNLTTLTLTGNTLGVSAAEAIAKALERHPELKVAKFSDMFTGRMKTEIPPALSALGEGMIAAGAKLSSLDLSDNAFGPIGVEGLAKLLQSDVCSELQELRLNNNGLGITGGRLLATALASRPRKLKIFIAGRNRLENDGAKALAKVFKEMGTLEELAMPQNGIYHVGISALSDAFKHNPNLIKLNLNDNTIGAKGAAAVAEALPKLKNLKTINFGDCLLKSKGASSLAKAFKDNSMLLECVDLSHNEIGRSACMEVVDALTHLPESAETLNRVVLAGNSLGGTANKNAMRDILGDAAELSDGEGSDDEYVTDSESDAGSDEEGSNADESDSSGETPHADTIIEPDITLDISQDTEIVKEINTEIEEFLQQPTLSNLQRLGSNSADVLHTYIKSVGGSRGVEVCACVCGVSEHAGAALWARVARTADADHVLRALALIKSEDKFKIRWSLPRNYEVLASVIDDESFPDHLRNTIKFFISKKMVSLPAAVQDVVNKHPNLLTWI